MHVPAWENRALASRPTDVRVCLVSKKKKTYASVTQKNGCGVEPTGPLTYASLAQKNERGVGAHADVMVGSGKGME